MKNNKELSKIRISTELYDKILNLLEQLNQNEAGLEIDLTSFRRMALTNFYNQIKTQGLKVNWDMKG